METIHEYFERNDAELGEGILGKLAALGLPMGGALGGGALGLLGLPVAGPAAPLAGWMAGKGLGTKAAEKLFPRDTAELMKKRMRRR